MAQFKLLNQRGADGTPRAAILADDDRVIDLLDALPGSSWAASTLSVLGAWDIAEPALAALAGASGVASRPLSSVELMAPLLYPPAIY